MKKRIFAVILSLLVVITMGAFTGCGQGSGGKGSGEALLASLDYDEDKLPDAVRDVMILEGTWEDMGKQYGEAYPDLVKMTVAAELGSILEEHTYEEVEKGIEQQLAYFDKYAPEVTELFRGISEGSGVEFDYVVAGFSRMDGDSFCSSMAAWGDATSGGKVIAGANMDIDVGVASIGGETCFYGPALICYPEGEHAFVTNGGFFSTVVMNDAGVCFVGSSGQHELEEDTDYGLPVRSPMTFLAAKCDTAEQAKDMYIDNGYCPGTGDNFHVVDENGSYLIEHTASKTEVRTAGDFGENDYTVATNDYMIESMKESMIPSDSDEFWDDCRPRYWTEERFIVEADGNADEDTFAKALGCNDFYIPENWKESGWNPGFNSKELKTGWNKSEWDLDHYQGFWSPENREPSLKAVSRGVAVPEDMTMYIMTGCSDTLVSTNPGAVGTYMNIMLNEDYVITAKQAKYYATMQNFLAARDIEQSGDANNTTRISNLDKAKEYVIKGNNAIYKGNLSDTKDDKRKYYSKAISNYCKAQCYAQAAQDEPDKIIRDGKDY